MRSGPVLDVDLFPEAERCALRLDGDCVVLGLTVIAVGVPIGPAERAASLAAATARYDLVVEGLTAAWVHGAVAELSRPLSLATAVGLGRRTKLVSPPPRRIGFGPADLDRLGGVLVTSPLRTAFDLLREEGAAAPEEAVARALVAAARSTPTIAAALAHLHPPCPGKPRGIARLAALR